MLPTSEFAGFVGRQSDTRLVRIFFPASSTVHIVRRAYFHTTHISLLPSFSILTNVIARQRSLEELVGKDGDSE